MMAHAFSLIPFLFVPLFPCVEYMIFASAMFTLFYRAETPALMEIIRRNLSKNQRETSYSSATGAAYVEGILLALFTGWMIEHLDSGWVYLFFFYALIGLFSLFFQSRLEISETDSAIPKGDRFSFLEPIRSGLNLLKTDKQFFRFQLGYFFCGGGLMFAMPAIPFFLTSHGFGFTTLFTSNSAIKEVGMILATPIWGLLMKRFRYETLSGVVFICCAVFLGTLQFIYLGVGALFLAYFVYGIAQAGSHLIWNLSGPYFSKEKDSSRFTMVNVFMVGLRGCLIPPLGGVVCDWCGPEKSIFYGVLFSLMGALLILQPTLRPVGLEKA